MVVLAKNGLLATMTTAALMVASPALAIDLASHQVTYELSMKEASPEVALEAITGKTIFRIVRECDGWKSGEDYIMQMRFEDGNEIYMASLFESYEGLEGDLFSFAIDESSNYEDDLSFDGFAQQTAPNSRAGEAFFSIAPDNALNLPDDTYFPVAQTIEILKQARAGKNFFTSHIFFGAKPDDALKKTSVIIGKKQPFDKDKSAAMGESTLLAEAYYPVQVAYFDPETTSGLPSYEISFQMQDNGVVPYYVIDYGDFELEATMKDLEKEPSPTCG